jgi:hypothetical protein
MLVALLESPEAKVVMDIPVKLFAKDPASLSVFDRASLAASSQSIREGSISGGLYVARAAALRQIWMPNNLPGEDGYLAAMIATSGFTEQPTIKYVKRIYDVHHFYDAHRSLAGYFRHERRIIVGSVINAWLYDVFWKEGKTGHCGHYVATQNQANERWLGDLVSRKVRQGGPWLIPAHFLFWRFKPLIGQSFLTKLRRLPMAIATTIPNLWACVLANQTLKKEGADQFW